MENGDRHIVKRNRRRHETDAVPSREEIGMLYVLRHKETSQILSTTLRNVYDLAYHGPVFWDNRREAEQTCESYLNEQNVDHGDHENWELIEISQDQLKRCNVKLNNEQDKTLFMGENGKVFVK